MKATVTLTRRLLLVLGFPLFVFAQSKEGGWVEKVTARVDGLACSFCAYGVEKKLERLDGVDSLDIRINQGLVVLYSRGKGRVDERSVGQKIKEAGFTLKGIERESFPAPDAEIDTDSLEKIHLNIRGMTCEYCVLNIESAIRDIEGVRTVSVDLEHSDAEVVVEKGKVVPDTLIKTISRLGSFEAAEAE